MKRSISALLTVVMVLTLLCVPLTVSASTTIDADTSWYNETDDVYYISTAAEFLGLGELGQTKNFAGKTIYLTADIDLNPGWTNTTSVDGSKNVTMASKPGNTFSSIKEFAGTIDGLGHTVSGIYVYSDQTAQNTITSAGLINLITGEAEIKNLNIQNSIHYVKGPSSSGSNTGIGALVGTVFGPEFTLKVTNVYLDMDLVFESNATDGKGMFAGIVGRVQQTKEPTYTNVVAGGAEDSALADVGHPENGVITEYFTVLDSVVYAGNVITMNSGKVASHKPLNVSQTVAGAGNFNLKINDEAGKQVKDTWRPFTKLINVVALGAIYSTKGDAYGEAERLNFTNYVEGAKAEGTAITASNIKPATSPTKYSYYDKDLAANFTYSASAGSMVPTAVALMLNNPYENTETYFQVTAGTTAASDKTNLRFVCSFAGSFEDYKEVGYVISLSESSPVLTTKNATVLDTNKLYSSIKANGEPQAAPNGALWLAVGINNIPNSAFGTAIYIRAYAKTAEGFVVYGAVQEVTVNAAFAAQ